jgi:hypothetical protein
MTEAGYSGRSSGQPELGTARSAKVLQSLKAALIITGRSGAFSAALAPGPRVRVSRSGPADSDHRDRNVKFRIFRFGRGSRAELDENKDALVKVSLRLPNKLEARHSLGQTVRLSQG